MFCRWFNKSLTRSILIFYGSKFIFQNFHINLANSAFLEKISFPTGKNIKLQIMVAYQLILGSVID